MIISTTALSCCSAYMYCTEGQSTTKRSQQVSHRGFDGKLRMGILPVSTFCSGHTFFVQRMAEVMGLKPYVVHATFQFSGTPGKRHRMRESLLWTAVHTTPPPTHATFLSSSGPSNQLSALHTAQHSVHILPMSNCSNGSAAIDNQLIQLTTQPHTHIHTHARTHMQQGLDPNMHNGAPTCTACHQDLCLIHTTTYSKA